MSIDYYDLLRSIREKLGQMNLWLLLIVCLLAGVGVAMLYSAGNGSMHPWAMRHLIRFSVLFGVMIVVALIDIRWWFRHAYSFYLVVLGMLVAVELVGMVGMGAQRWLSVGGMQLQPSELMKVALVLALARYFHGVRKEDVRYLKPLMVPLLLVMIPGMLILKQPDLGTALMLIINAGVLFFLAGVPLWMFGVVGGAVMAAVPLIWQYALHGYQKARVLTFLNPERDPLGTGYHIIQSKIALGSGGIFGKGFMAGSQSHLNFLPEKQTDFIFTMFAEEFGMVGAGGLLLIYSLLLFFGLAISYQIRNQFGRLMAMGITTNIFLYLFINTGMVMGLLPVVGVPLPLLSYGGTSMLTMMVGVGLLLSADLHRSTRLPISVD